MARTRRRVSLGPSDSIHWDIESDCIGLAINEPGDQLIGARPSPAPWQLDVFACTDAGRLYVGTLYVVPDPRGLISERIVGYGVCPGARAWEVLVTGPTTTQAAGITYWAELDGFAAGIDRAANERKDCCATGDAPGDPVGTYYVRNRTVTLGGAIAVNRVDAAFPCRLRQIYGSNESGSAGYLFLFNQSSVGAGLSGQPYLGQAFDVASLGSFTQLYNNNDESALVMPAGLIWGASSSANTYTAASNGWRVTSRLEW